MFYINNNCMLGICKNITTNVYTSYIKITSYTRYYLEPTAISTTIGNTQFLQYMFSYIADPRWSHLLHDNNWRTYNKNSFSVQTYSDHIECTSNLSYSITSSTTSRKSTRTTIYYLSITDRITCHSYVNKFLITHSGIYLTSPNSTGNGKGSKISHRIAIVNNINSTILIPEIRNMMNSYLSYFNLSYYGCQYQITTTYDVPYNTTSDVHTIGNDLYFSSVSISEKMDVYNPIIMPIPFMVVNDIQIYSDQSTTVEMSLNANINL